MSLIESLRICHHTDVVATAMLKIAHPLRHVKLKLCFRSGRSGRIGPPTAPPRGLIPYLVAIYDAPEQPPHRARLIAIKLHLTGVVQW